MTLVNEVPDEETVDAVVKKKEEKKEDETEGAAEESEGARPSASDQSFEVAGE